MEKSTDLQKERYRLAVKFNLSESQIEKELVPLMLAVEQSVNKIDQATAKINDSVKPVTYNNHYGHNASAWSMWWGNLSTGVAHHIIAVSLIFSCFLLCCLGIFVFEDYMSDKEKIQEAEKSLSWISRNFIKDSNGNYFIPKENYEVTPDRKGIRLVNKSE
jgi:hypothetical protein